MTTEQNIKGENIMTVAELEKAFKAGEPVVCRDIVYKYISAIIWRRIEDKPGAYRIQAELKAANRSNSVVTAAPREVKHFTEED